MKKLFKLSAFLFIMTAFAGSVSAENLAPGLYYVNGTQNYDGTFIQKEKKTIVGVSVKNDHEPPQIKSPISTIKTTLGVEQPQQEVVTEVTVPGQTQVITSQPKVIRQTGTMFGVGVVDHTKAKPLPTEESVSEEQNSREAKITLPQTQDTTIIVGPRYHGKIIPDNSEN